ncbi:MAG: hypothetical protein D6740_04580 [Alphaproteobacteria bacterium]|nr:MAG: hypothetical protein D6740_04580 [Alphaproteobacteria bacterium]
MDAFRMRLTAWLGEATRRVGLFCAGLFFLAVFWVAAWGALAWWLKGIWAAHWVWLLIAGVHLLLGLLVLGLALRRGASSGHAEPSEPEASSLVARDSLVQQALAQALDRQPERVLPVLLALDPLLTAARRHPRSSLAVAAVVGVLLGMRNSRQ